MRFKEKVFNILNMEIGNKHNLLDLSISLKEAGLLLKSNINTAETINLLSKTSPNKNLKKIFSEIYEFLLQGNDLYNSFLKINKFDNLFLALIKSGESSERLAEVFLYLSSYYEKKYKLKQKLISILTYPFILLSVTIVVLIFLLNNVIPVFLDIFEDSNEGEATWDEVVGSIFNGILNTSTLGIWDKTMNYITHSKNVKVVSEEINSISREFNPEPYLNLAFKSKDKVIEYVRNRFINELIEPLQEQLTSVRSKINNKEQELHDAKEECKVLEETKRDIAKQIEDIQALQTELS